MCSPNLASFGRIWPKLAEVGPTRYEFAPKTGAEHVLGRCGAYVRASPSAETLSCFHTSPPTSKPSFRVVSVPSTFRHFRAAPALRHRNTSLTRGLKLLTSGVVKRFPLSPLLRPLLTSPSAAGHTDKPRANSSAHHPAGADSTDSAPLCADLTHVDPG